MITNEAVFQYSPESKERKLLIDVIQNLKSKMIDIPNYIGNQEIRTDNLGKIVEPHNHKNTLAHFHIADEALIEQAITSALNAKEAWESLTLKQRANIFLKAASLAAGPYRYKLNAATMLGQSKNAYQAEIDSACELVDFFNFNVHYAFEIEKIQPVSSTGIHNSMEYRPLEGFVVAITPFNFTAIAGNLPTAPALMGNVVVWKPADTQIYAAKVIMELLIDAGLPEGVINLIYADGPTFGNIVFSHPEFAGLHYTGSTAVFKQLWKTIGNNLDIYKSFPRIVGETGGKDFVLAHHSANLDALNTALIRGAFEYQGQKCSAASRAYIPLSLWEPLKEKLLKIISEIKIGSVEDFSNFMNAVIDKKAFDRIVNYIEEAKNDPLVEVVAGGTYDDSVGYFIHPTILLCQDPMSKTMKEEIFGPVLSVFLYEDAYYPEILSLIDQSSDYALTGAVLAQDKYAAELAKSKLKNCAGNFYINDKPTGAVVGQQPFGGARLSGTNDKSGSLLNLLRWVSPRTLKETFVSPTDYKYPFLG